MMPRLLGREGGWFSLLGVLAAAVSALPAHAGNDPPLSSVVVGTGFFRPVCIAHAPGDTSRLFVVEQTGKIKIIKDGSVLSTPFLDVTSLIVSGGLENGCLSMVFHPDYQQNGFFYVYYTAPVGQASPVVSRFKVTSDPDVADFDSRVTVLHFIYNIPNHRAGWMDFDSEGNLYLSTGDGGEQDPQNNASNLAVLKGKILRLDVNGPDGVPGTGDDDGFPADPDRNYHIPKGNPFVDTPGAAPEIWAYGLRNPWRCSFDRANGDLWIGDVGQSAREEVDYLPAGTAGAFLGWRCMEGTVPTNYAGCTPPLPPSVVPIYEYPVSAVIGGYVYRGCAIPWLQGKYVFGNWGGQIWSLRRTTGLNYVEFANHTTEVAPGSIFSTFGEDALGELYLATWSNGTIRKIIPSSFIGPDCNGNSINDACDIASGSSTDLNGNGVPDECDPSAPCAADVAPLGGNGTVNVDDLLAVINGWGPCGDPDDCSADIAPSGGNDVVNVDDLLAVINGWGPCR